MTPKIEFNPPTFKGWTLDHLQQDCENPFYAHKDVDRIHANSLPSLLAQIRQAEETLQLFAPPIKATWSVHRAEPWTPIEFYAMREDRVFFRTEAGHQHSEFIANVRGFHADRFRLVTPEYNDIAKQLAAAIKANQKTYQKVVDLKKLFVPITEETFLSAPTIPAAK